MSEIRDQLRARLTPAEPEPEPAPSEPEPAETPQPEPAPEEPTPEPAPDAEPAPAAPAAPPTPAAPAQTDEEKAALRNELTAMQARIDQMQPELEQHRTLARERDALSVDMPTKEEWAEDPAKATERYHRNMTEAFARRMAQSEMSMQRMGADVWESRKGAAENAVLQKYPGIDMEKYRPSFEAYMARNPNSSPFEAIKAVANPADLIARKEPAPMTPAPKSAAAPKSGRAVRTGASIRKSTAPNSSALLQNAERARQEGDTRGHKQGLRSALEARLKETGNLIK